MGCNFIFILRRMFKDSYMCTHTHPRVYLSGGQIQLFVICIHKKKSKLNGIKRKTTFVYLKQVLNFWYLLDMKWWLH